jgi:hypothetical protein
MKTEIKTPRTISELRDMLFDELELLRGGKIAPLRARTTAALAFQIIDSVRVELLYRSTNNANQLTPPKHSKD